MYNVYRTQSTYRPQKTHNKYNAEIAEREGYIMAMTAEARAARARYMREWRKKNPNKQSEYDRRKWERKGEALRAARAAASEQTNDQ